MLQITKLILLTGILLYIILIISFFIGWIRKKIFIPSLVQSGKFVSIIVSVRNEEKNIPNLLQSLQNQSFPKEQFDIIVIDDHSTDRTLSIIQQFESTDKNVKCFSLPSGEEGKKSAIRFGLFRAKGELIVITDADCQMNKDWLSTIVAFQQITGANLIIAPVAYINKSFFEKMQALEFASLIASGASSANLGRPILCNGANLAFLKSVFPPDKELLNVNAPSGDDIFLLLNTKKTMRKSIHFLKSSQSIVYTNPSSGLKDFINQRKRWYSKSSHYADPEILGCGMLVTFGNFCLLISLVLAIVQPAELNFFLSVFVIKLLVDVTFLFPFLTFIKARQLIWLAPLLEILYPFYILYIMLSSRVGKYNWKGRNYKMN
jgi:cellulose synthase/poly-beta-1,6-N-acetylglucosamine synthase-like glycosyltransferase